MLQFCLQSCSGIKRREEKRERKRRRKSKRGRGVWPGIFPLCPGERTESSVARADTSFMDDIKLHSRILCEHGTSAYASRHYNV